MGQSRSPLLAQVSTAHLVSHLHMMVLPALLPILPLYVGVSFFQLGLGISVFNVVSALVQAPMGFVVDRFGPRRILVAGLILGSLSFMSLAFGASYAGLLVAIAVAGVANGVYHPADYALLSSGIAEHRMGRAFSVHTFSGQLGGAIAPGLMLGSAALLGTPAAFFIAGLAGLGAAAWLILQRASAHASPTVGPLSAVSARAKAPKAAVTAAVLSPTILILTVLFVLLSLSTNSIQNFSVTALANAYGTPLSEANIALSAFLFASALGVLGGGHLADKTQRHGLVAAGAFALTAALMACVALIDLPGILLIVVMGMAGFLAGVIAPSRDMLVRAASPKGAEGRTFGIVTNGFNIGGALGPVMFGWLLDQGHPRGVFWAAVGFMLLTVSVTLTQEVRRSRKIAVVSATS